MKDSKVASNLLDNSYRHIYILITFIFNILISDSKVISYIACIWTQAFLDFYKCIIHDKMTLHVVNISININLKYLYTLWMSFLKLYTNSTSFYIYIVFVCLSGYFDKLQTFLIS